MVNYDNEDAVSGEIIEQVSELEESDPVDLNPPLFSSINPEALDALYASNQEIRVEFSYHGYHITIEGPDQIEV